MFYRKGIERKPTPSSANGNFARVYCPELPKEQVETSLRQLRDDMQSCRIRHEQDVDASMEYARHHGCK